MKRCVRECKLACAAAAAAVLTHPPTTNQPKKPPPTHTDFKPVQRELVIDIDMSDYDELRTCGSGGHICGRCWPFMAVAIEVG
jgi:DNA primase small subunit